MGFCPRSHCRAGFGVPSASRDCGKLRGGSLGWVPGTSLPARMGWLIYAHSSHRCFPLLSLLTAHTSNSWDAPRQPLITLVCRPAHIPPGQGASCLPPFSLGFFRSPGPCPSTSSGKRSQAHGVPRAVPADVMGCGGTPRGKVGRAFLPRRCLCQAAATATAPSLGAGHGFRWHIAHFH